MELPQKKGLRNLILTEMFKNMSAPETLKCSLVCKEWLNITRSDLVWKSHFERDFIRLVPSKHIQPPKTGQEEKEEIKIEKFFDESINYEKNVEILRNYKFVGESPVFIEYWNLSSQFSNSQLERNTVDFIIEE